MYRFFVIVILVIISITVTAHNFEQDTFKTDNGDIVITFIGQGSLMFDFSGKIVYIDPVSEKADFSEMPKADIVQITHDHSDHLDFKAIEQLCKSATIVIGTLRCAENYFENTSFNIMKNGDEKKYQE